MTMDLKENIIFNHYLDLFQKQNFDEYDFQGFLITIRRHILKNERYKNIEDATNLIAHRDRDRGIAKIAMQNAISNNYATEKGSNVVVGYEGIDIHNWNSEWRELFKELNFDVSKELLSDITLCFYSLAQFSTFKVGILYLGADKHKRLSLVTTEGERDSLRVVFSLSEPFDILDDRLQIIYGKPVWTKRQGNKLRLMDEDGYII